MQSVSATSILLRRIAYGDYDLIVTLFTDRFGKLPVIAKYAKKSTKRFGGILEPFVVLNVVFSRGRTKGLPVLQEASLVRPFARIRTEIAAASYAGYWSELVDIWLEERHPQPKLYRLLEFALARLDQGAIPAPMLSVLFQMRFLHLAGLGPELERCGRCHCSLGDCRAAKLAVDNAAGGVVCPACGRTSKRDLSPGTVKQLLWLGKGDLHQALRVRFSAASLKEATSFLEDFVPYHLGRSPRSLQVLRQLR